MTQAAEDMADLIRKYDGNLPRYTSYPTAPHFHSSFTEEDYVRDIERTNSSILPKPLSLYLHIPFCHSLCYFCGCNKVVIANKQNSDLKVEAYLDALIQEIRSKAELFDTDRLVQQIHFGGGTPNYLSTSQLQELLEEIAQAFHLDLPNRLEIGIEIDPRYSDASSIESLSKLGFNRFSIGVQDFSSPVQQAVNRIQSKSATLEVIDAACSLGSSVNVDLITGLPKQTLASMKTTIETVASTGVSRIALYNFAYLPDRIKAQKLINPESLPNRKTRLALQANAATALIDLGFKHIGMDHFALESDPLYQALEDGSLQRNFQGYTTHADTDLIGLGVSAISSSDSAYSQNTVSVRDYISAITKDKFATTKGLLLSPDDKLRQKVIQQLMCGGSLNLSGIASDFAEGAGFLPLSQYLKSDLATLETFMEDGLIRKSHNGYTLTEKGRFFMRPIAACFDSYLNGASNSTGSVAQFSRAI